MTLVELIVVVAVLGVMAGVVGLAWRPGQWVPSGEPTGAAAIAAARRHAVEAGSSVSRIITIGDVTGVIRALPDGRVIGAERFGLDPLSGTPIVRDQNVGDPP